MKRFIFIIGICLLSLQSQISIADEKENAKYGDWNVFQSTHDGKDHCVAYSKPYRSTGSNFERNDPFMVISNKGKNENTIGVKPGYNIAGEKGFTVTVNRRSHLLDIKLTENAWTFSDKQDVVILNEMLEDGRSVKIRGYDHAGNVSVDYYSLRGLNYVIQYFNNNCSESN